MTGVINRDPDVCQRKKFYPTFTAAKRCLNNTNDPVHPFACSVCGGAHVGKTVTPRHFRDARIDLERESDRKALKRSGKRERFDPRSYDLE